MNKQFEVTPEEINFLAKYCASIYVEAAATVFILWTIITLLGKYVKEPFLRAIRIALLV